MVSTKCPICTDKRPFCIHKSYPLPKDFNLQKRVSEKLKKDFFGPSYSVFVGHYGYPNVNIGPMAGLEEQSNIDNPANWFGKSYQEIIEFRSLLIRSQQKENIFSRSRFISENQELALAKRSTDTEITFKKVPVYNFSLSDSIQPMGPTATLEKLKITENVKIARPVERIVSDDLKAAEQAYLLYKSGVDVYKISSIFSSGVMGKQENKKIVPTRWSLTGIQSIIADNLIKEIKQFPSINEYRVYSSEYLDNHFEILIMPGNWEFENFEVWAPGSNWSTQTQSRIIGEYEPYRGRTIYAHSQAGGFYSSRLGTTIGLKGLKKQARVVVFREVYEGYTIPVGSWQILENVRHAFEQPHSKFNTKQEALMHLNSKLRISVPEYMKKSVILRQKRLSDF
ncbi:MAG: hypothetical protein ABIJ92_03835 [Candidatus Aenigmatarchaeota archaeon]